MLFFTVALVVFVLDRLTKDIVTSSVPYGTEVSVIDHSARNFLGIRGQYCTIVRGN